MGQLVPLTPPPPEPSESTDIQFLPPPGGENGDPSGLSDDVKNSLIGLIYNGTTLHQACQLLNIGRQQVDLAGLHDDEFKMTLDMALAACQEIRVEEVDQQYNKLWQMFRDREIDKQGLRIGLSLVDSTANHRRWTADRASAAYARKKPSERKGRPKRKFDSGVQGA